MIGERRCAQLAENRRQSAQRGDAHIPGCQGASGLCFKMCILETKQRHVLQGVSSPPTGCLALKVKTGFKVSILCCILSQVTGVGGGCLQLPGRRTTCPTRT